MKFFYNSSYYVLLIMLTTFSSNGFASGFYNELQSTSAMGNAFAGAGAAGDDASIMFYNPAGIALFDEHQFVISGVYAIPEGIFSVDSATDALGSPAPHATGQQYSGIPSQVSPAVYAIAPLDDQFTLGMSFLSPYFLETDYSNTLVENTARQTQWATYTGNLTLAMEVTEALALAVGGNLQYFKTKMNAGVYGTSTSGNGVTGNGLVEYTGDDIAFYPNFGAMYEFTEYTRLGLNYRMNVKQETEGDFSSSVVFTNPDQTQEQITIISPATSDFYFPDVLSLDFFHQLNERIELLSTVMFMRWSQFSDIIVNTEQLSEVIFPNDQPINTTIDLQNTWRFALGANYYFTPQIKLRAGAAYDQSPVPEDNVTLQGPDSDRVDVSLGLMYQPDFWEDGHFDIAYMHTFFQDSHIAQLNPIANAFPGAVLPGDISAVGTFKTYVNYIGLQVVYAPE